MPESAKVYTFTRGKKFFELSNHLGNVLVTISDKKIGVDANNNGLIDFYTAEIISANDYYPFGMQMPGRSYSSGNDSYRYGFNGKENDNEVKGNGNQQDYGMRIYDPRLGKFLSVDPLTKTYPMLTPYQFACNSPIANIDLDGLEAWNVTKKWSEADIDGYAAYSKTKIQEMAANKVADDCANFALRLIVGYASENGLPLALKNSQGNSFDASSTSYNSTQQYLNDVRVNIQSKDLTLNTYNINQSETKSGDLEILHYSINKGKKVNFNHVVIFLDFNKDKPLKSPIVWGNLNTADNSGSPLASSQSNWARSSTYNDGTTNKFSIYSGNQNSRWSVLDPSTMTAPESTTPAPTTPVPSENCEDECH